MLDFRIQLLMPVVFKQNPDAQKLNEIPASPNYFCPFDNHNPDWWYDLSDFNFSNQENN